MIHPPNSPNNFLDAMGFLPRRRPCDIGLFQLNRWQLGSGASGVTPASSLTLLADPLEWQEYTGFLGGAKDKRNIYADVSTLLVRQATVPVFHKGISGDKIVHVLFLDEMQCNGVILNEIGLFVDNPFYFVKQYCVGSGFNPPIIADMDYPEPSDFNDPRTEAYYPNLPLKTYENPGSLLAAYRQFPEITKERDFSILFRWSITFKPNC